MRNYYPLRRKRSPVSAPASVGASKLRLEVATAGPHPYKYGRYWLVQIFTSHACRGGGKTKF